MQFCTIGDDSAAVHWIMAGRSNRGFVVIDAGTGRLGEGDFQKAHEQILAHRSGPKKKTFVPKEGSESIAAQESLSWAIHSLFGDEQLIVEAAAATWAAGELARLRQLLCLTPQEVADCAGVSLQTVFRLESGLRVADSEEIIERLVVALGGRSERVVIPPGYRPHVAPIPPVWGNDDGGK